MTIISKMTDMRHALGSISFSKPVLALAAGGCAIGLVAAGIAVSSGAISLHGLRKNVAAIGGERENIPQDAPREDVEKPASGSPELQRDNIAAGSTRISAPTFDIVRVEPDGNAVLAGVSAPGDQIEIMSGDDVLAKANANAAGEWALVLDKPLQAGGHQLAVRSTAKGVEEPSISVQTVTIAVPERSLESAIVMLEEPGEPSAVWQSPARIIRPTPPGEPAELQPGQPPDAAETVKPDAPAASTAKGPVPDGVSNEKADNVSTATANAASDTPSDPPTVTVEAIETEGDDDIYLSGASRPNAVVRLFLQNKLIGETVAGPVGRWRLHTTQLIPRGRLTVRAEEVQSSDGVVLARREVPFERDPDLIGSLAGRFDPNETIATEIDDTIASGQGEATVSGEMLALQRVVVGKGDNLWTIARRIYGSGVRYTTLYSANEDQIRDPATVFPDQVLLLPGSESLAN